MHPTTDQLDAFGRGDLTEAEARAIEGHLAVCSDCPSTLEGLGQGVDDPFVALLRTVGEESRSAETLVCDGPAPVAAVHTSGFDLIEPIGRGGMGVVFKARQRALGRVVALKQIHAGVDADAPSLARFRTEAEAVARLRHPNIVTIFDVGQRDGSPYIAMELVEGGSLADRLARGPLSPREAAALVEAIARAVHHAHERQVVHRDLKPANILIAADGAPKVADFGLARQLDSADGPTCAGALLGTPSYMAPEQAEGLPAAAPADIYALGAILYEALTGRPPFLGATPIETLDQVRHRDPIAPHRLQPNLPRDLDSIVLKALEKAPHRRYATADDLADDLARFLRGEPTAARPVGPIGRLRKWAWRRPSHAALAMLGVLAVAGALIGLQVHNVRLRLEAGRTALAAQEARAQKRLAEANYREARAAIVRILDTLETPDFATLPRRSEIRQAQIEAALGFYDRVLEASDSPDPAVRLDTAHAAREAAGWQARLGRGEPAEANLRHALRTLESLARDRPDDVEIVRDQLACWNQLGTILHPDRAAERIEALGRSLALAERLDLRNPSPRGRRDVAWCLHNLGMARLQSGRRDEAEADFRRSADLNRRGLAEDDASIGEDRRSFLAENLINIGFILSGKGPAEVAEADAAYEEAVALLEAAPGGQEEPRRLHSLCAALLGLGNLAARSGRPDRALEQYGRGLEAADRLMAVEPGLPSSRLTMLKFHGARANTLDGLRRSAEAAADWDRVVELNDDPAVATTYRLARAFCYVHAGRHDEATAAIDALVGEFATGRTPPSASDWYNCACVASLAAATLRDDEAIPEADRSLRAAALADRAVGFLLEADRAGFFRDPDNRALVAKDADLAAIRDRDELRRWIGDDPPTR